MALWQYDTYMLPRRDVDAYLVPNASVSKLNKDVRETLINTIIWGETIKTEEAISYIDSSLTRTSGWNESTTYWGPDDGSCVQISLYDEKAFGILVRFDLRSIDTTFNNFVVDLASRIDGVFVGQDGKLFENIDGLKSALANSNAYAFVLDPKEYLRSLADSNQSNGD